MYEHDEIPKLPEILDEERKEHEMDWFEFANARSRFIMYEATDKEPCVRFDELDEAAYANYIAVLSAPHNKKVVDFLTLVIHGVNLINKEKKKSFEQVHRVGSYLHNQKKENVEY